MDLIGKGVVCLVLLASGCGGGAFLSGEKPLTWEDYMKKPVQSEELKKPVEEQVKVLSAGNDYVGLRNAAAVIRDTTGVIQSYNIAVRKGDWGFVHDTGKYLEEAGFIYSGTPEPEKKSLLERINPFGR